MIKLLTFENCSGQNRTVDECKKLSYLEEKLLYVYGEKQKCREENNDGEKQSFSVMEIVLGMKTRREKKNQVENNKLRREKLKEGMQK